MVNIRFPLPLELPRMTERYLQSHRRLVFTSYRGADKSLARQGTSSEACQGRARFQQHLDASCQQVSFFPARQAAEGNSRHSDRNIRLFPSWSG